METISICATCNSEVPVSLNTSCALASLKEKISKYAILFQKYRDAYKAVNHSKPVSQKDCDEAQSAIDTYLNYAHVTFNWRTTANKAHILQEQVVKHMVRRGCGLTQFSEQAMEHANQIRKRSKRRTRYMNDLEGMLCDANRMMVDNVLSHRKKNAQTKIGTSDFGNKSNGDFNDRSPQDSSLELPSSYEAEAARGMIEAGVSAREAAVTAASSHGAAEASFSSNQSTLLLCSLDGEPIAAPSLVSADVCAGAGFLETGVFESTSSSESNLSSEENFSFSSDALASTADTCAATSHFHTNISSLSLSSSDESSTNGDTSVDFVAPHSGSAHTEPLEGKDSHCDSSKDNQGGPNNQSSHTIRGSSSQNPPINSFPFHNTFHTDAAASGSDYHHASKTGSKSNALAATILATNTYCTMHCDAVFSYHFWININDFCKNELSATQYS